MHVLWGSLWLRVEGRAVTGFAVHRAFSILAYEIKPVGFGANWARAFSGFWLMYCGPSIRPRSTGLGLGLYRLKLRVKLVGYLFGLGVSDMGLARA